MGSAQTRRWLPRRHHGHRLSVEESRHAHPPLRARDRRLYRLRAGPAGILPAVAVRPVARPIPPAFAEREDLPDLLRSALGAPSWSRCAFRPRPKIGRRSRIQASTCAMFHGAPPGGHRQFRIIRSYFAPTRTFTRILLYHTHYGNGKETFLNSVGEVERFLESGLDFASVCDAIPCYRGRPAHVCSFGLSIRRNFPYGLRQIRLVKICLRFDSPFQSHV